MAEKTDYASAARRLKSKNPKPVHEQNGLSRQLRKRQNNNQNGTLLSLPCRKL